MRKAKFFHSFSHEPYSLKTESIYDHATVNDGWDKEVISCIIVSKLEFSGVSKLVT